MMRPAEGEIAEGEMAHRSVLSILDGDLSACRQSLLAFEAPAETGAALLARFPEHLETFTASFGKADRRAAASLWTLWYFGTLIPASVGALVLLDQAPVLAPHRVEFALTPAGSVSAIRYMELDPGSRSLPPAERLQAFVAGHLQSVTEVVAEAVKLSPRVLWSNAAAYFAWAAAAIKTHTGRDEAELFIGSPQMPCGGTNPLFNRIEHIGEDGASVPRRRVCCLRYLLSGVSGCGALCPLPEGRA